MENYKGNFYSLHFLVKEILLDVMNYDLEKVEEEYFKIMDGVFCLLSSLDDEIETIEADKENMMIDIRMESGDIISITYDETLDIFEVRIEE